MLAIYCSDEELAGRFASACGGDRHVETFRAWARLRREFSRADQVIVGDPAPEPDLFARIHALERRDPEVPFVLVTRPDPDRLRWLSTVGIEEVVWIDEADDVLPLALRRSTVEGCFRELAAKLRGCSRLSPILQDALARATVRRPPFTSVRSLAAEVERDRRTIWHHWRDAVGDRRDVAPKGFLDWIILLRAAAVAPVRTTWRRVARDLGVPTRTIRRAADRRLGTTLQGLAALGFESVRERFRRQIVQALGSASPPERLSCTA